MLIKLKNEKAVLGVSGNIVFAFLKVFIAIKINF
jgi:hypothetical protein